jgi:glycine/D-amino acid oxidase-like deaminating enzyme
MPDRRPRSLWAETAAATDPTPSVEGLPHDADVAIVGAGYTGLWTAVTLKRAEPALRVCIVERDSVGFGASGRNGGWCSALFPIGLGALAARHGREAAIRLQRALIDTVGEVAAFADGDARALGVDVQFRQGGTLRLARSEAQRSVLRHDVIEGREFGFGADDLRLLDPDELATRCRAHDAVAASYSPHCAALHPLRLAQALAATARSLGVRIVEGVEVIEILPGALVTRAGTVHTPVTVLATEAYTIGLPGRRRDVLPMYSMMVGSEPLSAAQWDEIGLAGRETFTSTANMIIYGQRTADGRLAFGGRGAPYHFGSRIAPEFDTDERVRAMLRATLAELFPVTAEVELPFHWGGPLAVPRDWHPHVRFDRARGLASAGGYVGDGVAAANLAGRTLADLVLGRDTDLTHLPIVGHRSPRWEPEPLRWVGARVAAAAAARSDRRGPLAGAWARLFHSLTSH